MGEKMAMERWMYRRTEGKRFIYTLHTFTRDIATKVCGLDDVSHVGGDAIIWGILEQSTGGVCVCDVQTHPFRFCFVCLVYLDISV